MHHLRAGIDLLQQPSDSSPSEVPVQSRLTLVHHQVLRIFERSETALRIAVTRSAGTPGGSRKGLVIQ